MDAAALQAAVQQLQAALLQQQGQHAHDMQHMQAAVAAAAGAAGGGAAAGAPRPPTLRLPPLPYYNGASPLLDTWTAVVRQQYKFYGLADDASQMRLVTAYLSGPALDWFENPGAAGPPTTWTTLEAGLRARFQPVTTADTAREQLFALEQGRAPINDYVASFRRLVVALPTMDADTRMFQFRRGLTPALRLQLLQAAPTTLEAAISLAVRVGSSQLQMEGAAAAAAAPLLPSAMDLSAMLGVEAQGNPDAPITQGQFAMLLAAMHGSYGGGTSGVGAGGGGHGSNGSRGPPRVPGFTPEKVKQYMAAGMCFGCDATDHRSPDCPQKRVDAAGRVSWLKK